MSPSLEQRVKEWAEGLIETLEVWPPMKRQELIEHRARTLIAAVRAETIEAAAAKCLELERPPFDPDWWQGCVDCHAAISALAAERKGEL